MEYDERLRARFSCRERRQAPPRRALAGSGTPPRSSRQAQVLGGSERLSLWMNWLYLVSSVRCLACGTVYPKPQTGGTSGSNPGCPVCGYVGWVPSEDDQDEVIRGPEPSRFAADPLRLRFWRAG